MEGHHDVARLIQVHYFCKDASLISQHHRFVSLARTKVSGFLVLYPHEPIHYDFLYYFLSDRLLHNASISFPLSRRFTLFTISSFNTFETFEKFERKYFLHCGFVDDCHFHIFASLVPNQPTRCVINWGASALAKKCIDVIRVFHYLASLVML